MGVVDNFIHLFAPLTANCRDFGERWTPSASPDPDGVGGRWEGEWVSSVSGHRGRLRCVIDPVQPDRWRLYFRAEYAQIFRACYSTDFTVAEANGRWTFSGGSNLGALAGGVYEYSGHETRDEMICTYRSSKDHGEFRLSPFVIRH